jgi:hypothetical protein
MGEEELDVIIQQILDKTLLGCGKLLSYRRKK